MVSLTVFVEMILLASSPDMAALRFLQPLPICFLKACVPIFFAEAWKFFLPQKHLQFLTQTIPTSQEPCVLQLDQPN